MKQNHVYPDKRFLGNLFISSFIIFSVQSAYASSTDPILQEAQTICAENAKNQGFELKTIASTAPADIQGKDARVLLVVTRQGQEILLTCYYERNSKQVTFSNNTEQKPSRPENTSFPWWILLVSLLSLPVLLLVFLLKNPLNASVKKPHRHSQINNSFYKAVVVGNDPDGVSVYEQPSYNSTIINTVHRKDKVQISYDDNTNEWVRLSTGGWVPLESIQVLPQ